MAANLREELGLTQQHMATLLGISRNLYSMHELGLRNLPDKADQKLSQIKAGFTLANKNRPANTNMQRLRNADRQKLEKILHKRESKARNKHTNAVKLLEEVRTANDKSMQQLQMLGVLKTLEAGNPDTLNFLSIAEDKILSALNRTGLVKQILLEQQVEELQYKLNATLQRKSMLQLLPVVED